MTKAPLKPTLVVTLANACARLLFVVVVDIIDVNGDESLGILLTVEEVAHTLRLSSATVRRRISDGQLEAVRVGRGEGRSIRVPSRALERLLVPIGERDA